MTRYESYRTILVAVVDTCIESAILGYARLNSRKGVSVRGQNQDSLV
jgi:hypothetical protein